jgi:hypothetical protein
MTLDTLTRAQAEENHVRFQSSLTRTSQEFRERFKHDDLLFHTRSPDASSKRPLSSPLGSLHSIPKQAQHEEKDLVRDERVRQCCKRVRVWRRLAANPLLQYKQQQLAAARVGNGKKSDRRMHTTLLMTLIVDVYEQRLAAELETAANSSASTRSLALTTGVQHESLPEFVARFVSQRAPSRRAAADQLHGIVATVLHATAAGQRRVHLFGSLCGLLPNSVELLGTSSNIVQDASTTGFATFNPPERFQMFLHVLACLHRCKLATTPGNTRVGDDLAAAASMGDVVFHHAGISQHAAQKVVAELFRDDFYWNLRFWHAQCRELGVNYDWPPGASDELQARAVALAASSRNALLNASRKIDTDAFLELLVLAWTQRAREVHALLDAATDKEEQDGADRLLVREREQIARTQRRPLTAQEQALFAQLVDEFWNAPIPWTSARMQTRLAQAGDASSPRRTLDEVRAMYAEHVTSLNAAQRPWEWQRWYWEADWEWGTLIVLQEDKQTS